MPLITIKIIFILKISSYMSHCLTIFKLDTKMWNFQCSCKSKLPQFCMLGQLWLRVTWLKVIPRMPRSRGSWFFSPIEESNALNFVPRVTFFTIILRTWLFSAYNKISKILSHNFFYESSSFWVIALNVKFQLTCQSEITGILKILFTLTFANRAQNAPQDVPIHINHVTFSLPVERACFFAIQIPD